MTKQDNDEPTRRQTDALREQRDRGEGLREWLHGRERALERKVSKARKKREKARARAERAAAKKGEPRRSFEFVHEHKGSRATTGRPGTPYVNKARDAKRAQAGKARR